MSGTGEEDEGEDRENGQWKEHSSWQGLVHDDLAMTMEESTAQIGSEHPPGSFPYIFWE